MKKIALFTVTTFLLLAGTAMAYSVAGKVGVTARLGASYIFNSEFTTEGSFLLGGLKEDIKADTGWNGGIGVAYGLTDNLSVNFDLIYLQTDLKHTGRDGSWGGKFGTAKTVDFAFGVQWRFMLPSKAFVPYVGTGLDILWNTIDANISPSAWANGTKFDADPTYGIHVSAGADYFFTPRIALNAEIRGLYSTRGNMTYKYPGDGSFTAAKYDPSNISGFLGLRFFFP